MAESTQRKGQGANATGTPPLNILLQPSDQTRVEAARLVSPNLSTERLPKAPSDGTFAVFRGFRCHVNYLGLKLVSPKRELGWHEQPPEREAGCLSEPRRRTDVRHRRTRMLSTPSA